MSVSWFSEPTFPPPLQRKGKAHIPPGKNLLGDCVDVDQKIIETSFLQHIAFSSFLDVLKINHVEAKGDEAVFNPSRIKRFLLIPNARSHYCVFYEKNANLVSLRSYLATSSTSEQEKEWNNFFEFVKKIATASNSLRWVLGNVTPDSVYVQKKIIYVGTTPQTETKFVLANYHESTFVGDQFFNGRNKEKGTGRMIYDDQWDHPDVAKRMVKFPADDLYSWGMVLCFYLLKGRMWKGNDNVEGLLNFVALKRGYDNPDQLSLSPEIIFLYSLGSYSNKSLTKLSSDDFLDISNLLLNDSGKRSDIFEQKYTGLTFSDIGYDYTQMTKEFPGKYGLYDASKEDLRDGIVAVENFIGTFQQEGIKVSDFKTYFLAADYYFYLATPELSGKNKHMLALVCCYFSTAFFGENIDNLNAAILRNISNNRSFTIRDFNDMVKKSLTKLRGFLLTYHQNEMIIYYQGISKYAGLLTLNNLIEKDMPTRPTIRENQNFFTYPRLSNETLSENKEVKKIVAYLDGMLSNLKKYEGKYQEMERRAEDAKRILQEVRKGDKALVTNTKPGAVEIDPALLPKPTTAKPPTPSTAAKPPPPSTAPTASIPSTAPTPSKTADKLPPAFARWDKTINDSLEEVMTEQTVFEGKKSTENFRSLDRKVKEKLGELVRVETELRGIVDSKYDGEKRKLEGKIKRTRDLIVDIVQNAQRNVASSSSSAPPSEKKGKQQPPVKPPVKEGGPKVSFAPTSSAKIPIPAKKTSPSPKSPSPKSPSASSSSSPAFFEQALEEEEVVEEGQEEEEEEGQEEEVVEEGQEEEEEGQEEEVVEEGQEEEVVEEGQEGGEVDQDVSPLAETNSPEEVTE